MWHTFTLCSRLLICDERARQAVWVGACRLMLMSMLMLHHCAATVASGHPEDWNRGHALASMAGWRNPRHHHRAAQRRGWRIV